MLPDRNANVVPGHSDFPLVPAPTPFPLFQTTPLYSCTHSHHAHTHGVNVYICTTVNGHSLSVVVVFGFILFGLSSESEEPLRVLLIPVYLVLLSIWSTVLFLDIWLIIFRAFNRFFLSSIRFWFFSFSFFWFVLLVRDIRLHGLFRSFVFSSLDQFSFSSPSLSLSSFLLHLPKCFLILQVHLFSSLTSLVCVSCGKNKRLTGILSVVCTTNATYLRPPLTTI
ncbi:hypothetical protein K435DRAFT_434056 [Dendrothele bispora CBS 962.96]|uniref:Uncharacterized protein n=1 Tax=Dendrothele bispora (strain CBS 962.96) TaxID=1314807 RepID=A0A4S8L3P1_DENBC|nr:hypothetical protein K435DRAFT_434056 [Dendrothele bispora CBS 962.96]